MGTAINLCGELGHLSLLYWKTREMESLISQSCSGDRAYGSCGSPSRIDQSSGLCQSKGASCSRTPERGGLTTQTPTCSGLRSCQRETQSLDEQRRAPRLLTGTRQSSADKLVSSSQTDPSPSLSTALGRSEEGWRGAKHVLRANPSCSVAKAHD